MNAAMYSPSIAFAGESGLWENPAPDGITHGAIWYLTIPLLIFFVTWFSAVPGIALALLVLFALRHMFGRLGAGPLTWPSRKVSAVIGLVALGWATCGGAGHFVYANTLDWMVRDAVLRDITLAQGPAAYGFGGEDSYILRAPLAYYLPAAMLGKVFGLRLADFFLWAWTVLGVWFFLALLPIRWESRPRLALLLLVPVLFSGLDILGYMFPNFSYGALPFPYAQLDWWIESPPRVAYVSNAAQLFWSPNHAIPAWIATALLYRHWRHARFQSLALILCAALPLWSPFALIGIFPFVMLGAYQSITRNGIDRADIPAMIALIPVVVVLLLYLTHHAGEINYDSTFSPPPRHMKYRSLGRLEQVVWFAKNYLMFVIFEFGILALLVFGHIMRPIMILSVAILLVLPLLSFGPVNDLGMRASISSLTMLCIASLNYIQGKEFKWQSTRAWFLVAALLIGSISAATEFYRALTWKRWSPNLEFNLKDAAGGTAPPHYMSDMSDSLVLSMLRRPSVLPSSIDWFYVCEATHPDILSRRPYVPSVRRSD